MMGPLAARLSDCAASGWADCRRLQEILHRAAYPWVNSPRRSRLSVLSVKSPRAVGTLFLLPTNAESIKYFAKPTILIHVSPFFVTSTTLVVHIMLILIHLKVRLLLSSHSLFLK
eukprot:TRINITY_DN16908_c0_g2_i5.p1 TRINITY_DN16908_c0_g2~~TRINITY_DN16908_c0_g2_i5.p1  ORF type:complete len:115 (-),score=2.77 TRINITY_DN16908_c0_g2_i5:36-380(-)